MLECYFNTDTCSEIIVHPEHYARTSQFVRYSQNSTCLNLTPSNPVATLDYSTEVGGFPFFDAIPVSGPVQVEAKYSEAKGGLDQPFGDGPWTFSNGLANTFRVETFNITEPGQVESFFQQGGLRWQRLRLLNDDRNVTICGIGIRSYNDRTDPSYLPGYFECSNPLYNEIWKLGARTVQQACIENGTAPTTWQATPDGVLLRGQQSAQSVLGADFANYTMSFKTKIVRGGTGWRVATSPAGFGPSFLLTSEYPKDSTFLNKNRTLVPPNTLAVGYGWNLVNQTSLPTGKVSYFPVDFNVTEGQWMDISTRISNEGYVVTINGRPPVTVSLAELQLMSNERFSSGSVYSGTWGFGPWQDQTAYVKDVLVQSRNGTVLYLNTMTGESVLEEYGVMDNQASLCLDGAKRDRLVWSGDFAHVHRVVSASTYRPDFIRGTLGYLFERQEQSGPMAGLFAMSPAMGQSAEYASVYKSYGLLDYQMLLLNSFARYYLESADRRFLAKWWPKARAGVEAILPLIDQYSGLAATSSLGAFFLGDGNGTAASALLTYTLIQMADLADAMGEPDTSTDWKSIAANIARDVNQKLWNENIGTYSSSLTSMDESSYIGTAWAILSNTANTSQAALSIAALSSLRLGIGYKVSTDMDDSDPETNLSPNLLGFLLEALFTHARDHPYDNATAETVSFLLDGLWAAMVDQDEYYTGTSWEYVYPDGRPGLDLFTSHAHPWGGAPTYIFSEYVLGVQPTAPGFEEWSFRPVVMDGLTCARGRVPTPRGTIHAEWGVGHGMSVTLKVRAPVGTRGVVSIPLAARGCHITGDAHREYCGGKGVRVVVDGKWASIDVFLAQSIPGL